MGIGFLILVVVVLVLLRYTFTIKERIALAVLGTLLFGVASFALYKQARRGLSVSYYQEARDRLFQPESKKENYLRAIALFKQELEHSSGNVPARAWLSISEALLYRFFQRTDRQLKDEACENANEAWRLDRNSAEAHLALARCAALENDDNKVDAELLEVSNRNPSDPWIWLAAAVTEQWRGQDDKATAYYDRAQTMARDEPRISFNYGHHLYEMGERDKSCQLLDHAVDGEPKSAYFAVVRAVAEISWTGNVQEARKVLNRIPENVNPDCRMSSARCTLALYERDFDAALGFVRECRAHMMFSVDAGGLGEPDTKSEAEATVLVYKGDPEAKKYYEEERPKYLKAVRLKPDSSEYNAALALCDAWTGRKDEAIEHAETALKYLPERGPEKKGVLLGVAKAFAWAGEIERAWVQIKRFQHDFKGKTGMSKHNFRLDPAWYPMRDHPEFRKFVE
jgi:tetratricopeptide (TPR) repeat protein